MPASSYQHHADNTDNTNQSSISCHSIHHAPAAAGQLADLTQPWPNTVIAADNLFALQTLQTPAAQSVDLIYIDPPFDVGVNFKINVNLDNHTATLKQDRKVQSQVAYRDRFGLQNYLDMLRPRIELMHALLAPTGSFVIHIDWRVVHYVKVMIDDIFGPQNFRNEIVWRRGRGATRTASKQFPHNHDTLLIWSKTDQWKYQRLFRPYAEATLKMFRHDDHDDRGPYRLQELRTYSETSIEKFRCDNRLVEKPNGKRYFKQYLRDKPGVAVDSIWDDIGSMPYGAAAQATGFPTQKPLDLLNRLIQAFTEPGDCVADFFAGSGTTAVAAHQLNRRFIICDQSPQALSIIRKRLWQLDTALPVTYFDWQPAQTASWFHRAHQNNLDAYRRDIADLYRAQLAPADHAPVHAHHQRTAVIIAPPDQTVTHNDITQLLDTLPASFAQHYDQLDILACRFDPQLTLKRPTTSLSLRLVLCHPAMAEPSRSRRQCLFTALPQLRIEQAAIDHRPAITLHDYQSHPLDHLADAIPLPPFPDAVDHWAVDWHYRPDTPFHVHSWACRTNATPQLPRCLTAPITAGHRTSIHDHSSEIGTCTQTRHSAKAPNPSLQPPIMSATAERRTSKNVRGGKMGACTPCCPAVQITNILGHTLTIPLTTVSHNKNISDSDSGSFPT